VLRKSSSPGYELTKEVILWSKVLEKVIFPKEQKKVSILSNPKFRYRVQQRFSFLKTPVNINNPSTLGSWHDFLSFSLIHKNNVRISFPMQSYNLNIKHYYHAYNKGESLYGTYLKFVWNIIAIYMEHTCNLYGTYLQFVWNILAICLEHNCHLYGKYL